VRLPRGTRICWCAIVNQENLDLEALTPDRVYRFMYVCTPVPIAGATGSPGSPIAIKLRSLSPVLPPGVVDARTDDR
jgi:hypothetical protein